MDDSALQRIRNGLALEKQGRLAEAEELLASGVGGLHKVMKDVSLDDSQRLLLVEYVKDATRHIQRIRENLRRCSSGTVTFSSPTPSVSGPLRPTAQPDRESDNDYLSFLDNVVQVKAPPAPAPSERVMKPREVIGSDPSSGAPQGLSNSRSVPHASDFVLRAVDVAATLAQRKEFKRAVDVLQHAYDVGSRQGVRPRNFKCVEEHLVLLRQEYYKHFKPRFLQDNPVLPGELEILRKSGFVKTLTLPIWDDLHEGYGSENVFMPCEGHWEDSFTPRLSPLQLSAGARYLRVGSAKPGAQFCVIRSADPLNVKQTVVGDCSVVCSFIICASYQQRFPKAKIISNVIFPQDVDGNPLVNPKGKYCVKMLVNGATRLITVDDRFPIDPKTGEFLCTYSRDASELWVSIMEKAFVKVCGGSYDFPGSSSSSDLYKLCGWLPDCVDLQNKGFDRNLQWARFSERYTDGSLLMTVSTPPLSEAEEKKLLLASEHAYAVLDVREVSGVRLLKLMNPWGRLAWSGRYSVNDKRPEAVQLLTRLQYTASLAEQGVFWITWDDLCRHFSRCSLSWNPYMLFKSLDGMSRRPTRLSCHAHFPYTTSTGQSPQFHIGVVGTPNPSRMHVVFSRHMSDATAFAQQFESDHPNIPYISVKVYRVTQFPSIAQHAGARCSVGMCYCRRLVHGTELSADIEPLSDTTYRNMAAHTVSFNCPAGTNDFIVVISRLQSTVKEGFSFSLTLHTGWPQLVLTEPTQRNTGVYMHAIPRSSLKHCTQLRGRWVKGVSCGGRGALQTFVYNPQYLLSLSGPSMLSARLCLDGGCDYDGSVQIYVMQKERRGAQRNVPWEARVGSVAECCLVLCAPLYAHGGAVVDTSLRSCFKPTATQCVAPPLQSQMSPLQQWETQVASTSSGTLPPLPAGDYTVVPAQWEKGIPASFELTVETTEPHQLREIPPEGDGWKETVVHGRLQGGADATVKSVMSRTGECMLNTSTVSIVATTSGTLTARLLLLTPPRSGKGAKECEVNVATNLTVLQAADGESLGPIATSGPYKFSGVSLEPVKVAANTKYVVVVSSAEPSDEKYVLRIYSDCPLTLCVARGALSLRLTCMHVGRNAASDWMRRHTRASTVQQRRTTPAVSSVAARTIAKIIEVGGSNCWAAALQIYAEALATRSVRQDGTVVLFHRHNSIACILDAMPSCVENSNGGSLEGMASKPPPRGFVAGRLAMDIVAPSEGTAPEEWNAAASACRAVLRSLLMTHRLYAARRFARYLMRVRDSHLYGRWALHTIMKAVPHAWEATHRKALLRGGLLDDVVQLTGLDPFVAMALPCEQRERNEEMCYEQTRKSMDREEVDRLVARWCVDAAQQMNTCPWTLCFATDALPRTQTFSREVVSYCCIKLIPMPSVIAGMLPVAVLRDDAIAILRCCIAHGSSLGIDGDCASVSSVVGDSCYTFTGGGQGSVLEVSAVRKLQDVVSVVIDSPRCPSEPVECLGLLFQLLNGSTIINSDHSALTLVSDWWWRQQLRRCIPQHVSTAITWKAVCDAVGLSDLPTRTAPHSFPLLVAQAAHSPDALETLFKVVIEKSGSSLPVDDIPGTCAKNLLYRCKDEKCTPVIDWIVQHCQDHKFMGKFILDNLKENRNTASLVLQRVLHYDRHCNYEIINVLSHMLEASSAGTHLADVCALLPQSQQWALALRCVGSMAAPTIGHVSAAFTALAGGCGEPFALDMALLWKDDTFTWLRANVDPPPSPTQMDDRWEVALRLIAMGTERLKTRPELCRRYVRCLSRSVSVNSRLYAEINTYLTCLLAGSAGLNTVFTSCGDGHEYGGKCAATASAADAPLTKVRLRALVASKRWVEACACASKVGATRDLLELLAQRGRWEETARLVAGAATKRRMACFPLVVRAARLSGCWKAALFTVDKMVSEGVKLHYAVVAELLACCSSANVPLEVVQLWFHKRVVGKDGVSHTLIGLGTSTRSRKGSGGNNSSYDANVIERSGCFNTARDEFLFAALDSSSARFTDQQWCYALQLLREHVLLSGGIPSHRVFRSTFSMLHRARRWRESLQLLQIQRSVGCPPNVKCVRLVLSTLPTTAWRYALEALRTIPPGDSGSVHRVLPVLLPVCWESALGLVAEHGVLTNTVMERIVSCERVPLPLRLHAWRQLLPSLPVSMKHNTAPVYLQLSLAVADNGPCLLNTLDAMCIIEQSIRGLRVDYMNYASFVYYRAQLHRHWCNTNLDPADGVAAFRSLSKIADVEHRCEISAATLEQLSNLVERQRSGCGASVTVTPACSASRSLKHTMPGSDASFTGM